MWLISLSKKTNIHILSNKTDGNSVTNAPWLTLGCNGPERGMALPRLLKPFQIPDIWPRVFHMPIWILGMIERPDSSSPVQVASISWCRSKLSSTFSDTRRMFSVQNGIWVHRCFIILSGRNPQRVTADFFSLKTNRVKVKHLTTALHARQLKPLADSDWIFDKTTGVSATLTVSWSNAEDSTSLGREVELGCTGEQNSVCGE